MTISTDDLLQGSELRSTVSVYITYTLVAIMEGRSE
jgi:hypothetical protein